MYHIFSEVGVSSPQRWIFIFFDCDPNELRLKLLFFIFLLQKVIDSNLFIGIDYAMLFIYFIADYWANLLLKNIELESCFYGLIWLVQSDHSFVYHILCTCLNVSKQ